MKHRAKEHRWHVIDRVRELYRCECGASAHRFGVNMHIIRERPEAPRVEDLRRSAREGRAAGKTVRQVAAELGISYSKARTLTGG